MLRRILIAVLWAGVGYVAGGFAGGFLVYLLSSNVHDRDLEAAMTGAFFIGPAFAILAFAVAYLRASAAPRDNNPFIR